MQQFQYCPCRLKTDYVDGVIILTELISSVYLVCIQN